MKAILISITFFLSITGYTQNTLVVSQILNSTSTNIYKEATCINKIGELRGRDYVFVLDKKDDISFLVYRNGITGYISWNWLKVWQKDYLNLGGNIDEKIALAKIKEIEIDEQRKSDSILINKTEAETKKQNKKQGIYISELEYIDGRFYCGFNFTITNYSDKTIKYLNISVSAYNPVNDFVANKKFSYVGPIYANEDASYKSDLAFDQNAINHYKIKKISVQYLNGTIREYVGSQLKEVINEANY